MSQYCLCLSNFMYNLKKKNFEDIKSIKHYQSSVLNFCLLRTTIEITCLLMIKTATFAILIVLLILMRNLKTIYRALEQCFDKYQSTKNLLISNFILMNYSYYIVRNNLTDLKSLRRHVSSDMFRQIISSIVYRGFCE
jgi:hypothetical protein